MKTTLALLAASAASATALEITSFQLTPNPWGGLRNGDAYVMEFSAARVDGQAHWPSDELSDIYWSGWIRTAGEETSAGFYHHGAEENGEFRFNNVTGEVLDVTCFRVWDNGEPPEMLPFELQWSYNATDGNGLLAWAGLVEPGTRSGPTLQGQVAGLPDGGWTLGLMGVGLLAVRWRPHGCLGR